MEQGKVFFPASRSGLSATILNFLMNSAQTLAPRLLVGHALAPPTPMPFLFSRVVYPVNWIGSFGRCLAIHSPPNYMITGYLTRSVWEKNWPNPVNAWIRLGLKFSTRQKAGRAGTDFFDKKPNPTWLLYHMSNQARAKKSNPIARSSTSWRKKYQIFMIRPKSNPTR